MFGIPESSLGAVIAATIAGVVSLLGLIVSKEQKVSDFRQAWIDALRLEIATVITHSISLHGISKLPFEDKTEIWDKAGNHFVEINKAGTAIRLRLNPDEPDCKAILSRLDELENILVQFPIDQDQRIAIENAIIKHSQCLLKNEWVRVRNGERVYKVARLIATLVVILGSAFVFISYAKNSF